MRFVFLAIGIAAFIYCVYLSSLYYIIFKRKGCPFCGSKDHVRYYYTETGDSNSMYYVCDVCKAEWRLTL